MTKNIVFCADGTWNGPDKDEDHDSVPELTNVVKLFHKLEPRSTLDRTAAVRALSKTQVDAQRNVVQVARYLHGVGDSDAALAKVLGGSTGAGFGRRIVDGFLFLSRNYAAASAASPLGDRLFILGFSRGAYTARALAGMVCRFGLLRTELLLDQERAERLAWGVWRAYKDFTRGAETALLDKIMRAITPLRPETLVPDVTIEAVGVWDTVGSLGVPLYLLKGAEQAIFQFADTRLHNKVRFGYHAMALDERREDFLPTPWDSREGVEQVWFSGAHADVGGGYEIAQSGLSDIALRWMCKKLTGKGLLFADTDPIPISPDHAAAIHEPWNEGVWKLRSNKSRSVPAGASLAQSVAQRMSDPRCAYDPHALNVAPAGPGGSPLAALLSGYRIVD